MLGFLLGFLGVRVVLSRALLHWHGLGIIEDRVGATSEIDDRSENHISGFFCALKFTVMSESGSTSFKK